MYIECQWKRDLRHGCLGAGGLLPSLSPPTGGACFCSSPSPLWERPVMFTHSYPPSLLPFFKRQRHTCIFLRRECTVCAVNDKQMRSQHRKLRCRHQVQDCIMFSLFQSPQMYWKWLKVFKLPGTYPDRFKVTLTLGRWSLNPYSFNRVLVGNQKRKE